MASSFDGTFLIATSGDLQNYTGPGGIVLSSDSGNFWNPATTPTNGCLSVACSTNFSQLVLASHFEIYLSTNMGANWISSSAPALPWRAVASSDDGTNLVAAASGYGLDFLFGPVYPAIYTSGDSGKTWKDTGAPSNYWYAVASSADGLRLIAAGNGSVCTSTNRGQSWISNALPALTWQAAASSADGTKLFAAAYSGSFYASLDGGCSWRMLCVNTNANWNSISCSQDGSKIVAVSGNGIYTSSDYGMTWFSNNAPALNWSTASCSADGNKMAAGAYGDALYTAHSAPSLRIARLSNQVVLSWPAPSAGFMLQQIADVAGSNWAIVTNRPTVAAYENQETISLSFSNCFYRLISN